MKETNRRPNSMLIPGESSHSPPPLHESELIAIQAVPHGSVIEFEDGSRYVVDRTRIRGDGGRSQMILINGQNVHYEWTQETARFCRIIHDPVKAGVEWLKKNQRGGSWFIDTEATDDH